MRLLVSYLLLIVCLTSAVAEGADSKASWWETLPTDERYSIQADLVLLGFYDGFVDGKFGPLTGQALERYQLSRGERLAIPSQRLLTTLRSAAIRAYNDFGFVLERHPKDGVAAYVPRAILTKNIAENDGGVVAFANEDESIVLILGGEDNPGIPLAEWAPELLRETRDKTITYRSVRDDRLVISGRLDGVAYYSLLAVDHPKVVSVTVSWTDEHASEGAIIATFVASYSGATKRLEQFETPPEPATVDSDEYVSTVAKLEGHRLGPFLLPYVEPKTIALVGEIDVGTVLDFRRALKARPDATTLVLDSVGGSVNEGLLLAHEVADHDLSTFVPRDAGCYSACAYVFFAGKARSASGALGVHQIYGADVTASDAQAVLSDVLDALAEFEVPQAVISNMLRTPPEEMYVFSEEEKDLLRLNRGDLNVAILSERKVETIDTTPDVQTSDLPTHLRSDTIAAFQAEMSNLAFQYLGVWGRLQKSCENIDTINARDFAVITNSSFRDDRGSFTSQSPFRGTVNQTTTLNVTGAGRQRKIEVKQWATNIISIDGVTMIRCTPNDLTAMLELGL